MKAYGKEANFPEILDNLGLLPKFNTFATLNPDLFKHLAINAPAYVDCKMTITRRTTSTRLASKDKAVPSYIGKTNEKAVTTYFSELIFSMGVEVEAYNKSLRPRSRKPQIPVCTYRLADHQTRAIKGGSGLKADFAFYYPGAASMSSVHILLEAKKEEHRYEVRAETLKQIVDYQTIIWQKQPSRVIVPILLLHGAALSLVVFTRNNWHVVDLGNLCYTNVGVLDAHSEDVRSVMVQLYFLLTLKPEEFGHFCGLFEVPSYWRFDRVSTDSADVTIEISNTSGPSVVKLVSHMERAIHPRHRLAHVYKVIYGGKDAILKLSWTPISTVPEGAIYELLTKTDVEKIPAVYESGVIKRDLFGYRLEYLVLENCGLSIERYLEAGYGERFGTDSTFIKARNVVQGTIRCLTQARVFSGILHRDISTGNVMVRSDGSIKVIDWGYGKLLPVAGLVPEVIAHRKVVATKWGYKDDSILALDEPASATNIVAHNPLTGTPLYMSIPVLCGANVRGIIDDFESLFYVIMHALSALEKSSDPIVCAFDFRESRTLAMVRTGCLADPSVFLQFFGVTKLSDQLRQLLHKLREYLFVDNGKYIAPSLVVNAYTPRGTNLELLRGYIDEDTMSLLQEKDSPLHI
ncbi:hypothetical protein GGI24_001586 [Coemansia furcata]|nr:hypothetical protein GGI24_001586 [Coemansia furcata]